MNGPTNFTDCLNEFALHDFSKNSNLILSITSIVLTMFLKASLFFFFTILFSLWTTTLAEEEAAWIDDKIKKPSDFKAFFTKPTEADTCTVEINFQRDFNDQRYEYNVFAVYDNGQRYFLKPVESIKTESSLAAVDATPKGQRGAYLLKSGYTLTPIIVNICNIGANDTNFPPDLKGKIPNKFTVQAVPANVAHADKTVWKSVPFEVAAAKNETTPPSVTDVKALKSMKDQISNENVINVNWKTNSDSENVQGYFILAGPGEDASKVQSILIEDPKATQGKITIGYHTKGYDVAVVTWTKSGALTSPAAVAQVNITQI